MPSSEDFVEYFIDQLHRVKQEITYRRMFGEYCIYANGKPIMFIIDNKVYVKRHPSIDDIMHPFEQTAPLEDRPDDITKRWYMVDIEDSSIDLEWLVDELEKRLPMPRPKKRKGRKKKTKI